MLLSGDYADLGAKVGRGVLEFNPRGLQVVPFSVVRGCGPFLNVFGLSAGRDAVKAPSYRPQGLTRLRRPYGNCNLEIGCLFIG